MRLPEDLKTPCSFAAIVLICAFAVITFYRLGNRPLQDYDEAIYAQVAHEAMQSGNQLGFTWLGNPPLHRTEMWFEKPPVMLWLTELSYAAFGVNEFAARFWTAILAIFTLPLTFLFARDLANAAGVAGGGPAGARPRDFSSRAALLSVVSFFAAFQFSDDARIMQMDIPAGFFVLLAMFGFWRARERFGFHFLFWNRAGRRSAGQKRHWIVAAAHPLYFLGAGARLSLSPVPEFLAGFSGVSRPHFALAPC